MSLIHSVVTIPPPSLINCSTPMPVGKPRICIVLVLVIVDSYCQSLEITPGLVNSDRSTGLTLSLR